MIFLTPEPFTFTVPLTRTARKQAERFCEFSANLPQGERIYLKTLAVYAVDYYLQCLGIATALNASDSQDPLSQLFCDRADLEVTNCGKLECCPLPPESEWLEFPADLPTERIGYVAVELNAQLSKAKLLGFAPKVTSSPFPLDRLQPLETLPRHLEQFRRKISFSEWIDGILQSSWQPLEEVFPRPLAGQRGKRSRPKARRVKKLDLGLRLDRVTVALVVMVQLETEALADILIQVLPLTEGEYLPTGLKLIIELESESAAVVARAADNLIQLELSEPLGSPVAVRVEWGETVFNEEFVV